MRKIAYLFASILLVFLTGCASAPMASGDKDAASKTFTTQNNKDSIYIYRNESFGGAIPMEVTINGKLVGHTAAKSYFHFNVDPGEYKIESHSENISSLTLPVQASKIYFLWQEVKMGVWKARSNLQQVDEKTGRSGVIESKLIAASAPESEIKPTNSITQTSTKITSTENMTPDEKLRKLQDLKEKGLISEDDFSKKKTQILKEL